MSVLAIDAGTTGVTAAVVSEAGVVVARGYAEFPQHFPRPGWVEHEPEEIWQATLRAGRTALTELAELARLAGLAGAVGPADSPGALAAVGVTNQRETAVLWDRRTLAAPRRAIVWQDRRTAGICRRLRDAGEEERVAAVTGLRLDPYFTGTKLTWLAEHDPELWAEVRAGAVAVGTVDSYLVARLTGGAHVTDPTNASRTLLFDLRRGEWSGPLCELLGVPPGALPQVVPSYGVLGRTDPSAFLGVDVPVAGIAGDQQAALVGQACVEVGDAKCTYGTGSFVLVNTGAQLRADPGLLTTVAWGAPDGTLTYALEGSVFVTGAAVQWLRDGLGLIGSAAETEAVARTVPDAGGVVFVPALTGLGAPDWDPAARGAILGLTRGTTRAHLVRATLEAIAFEVRDVVEAFGVAPTRLKADGGAAVNDLLLQLQADQLGLPVQRPEELQSTALGAAYLAGLGVGVWASMQEVSQAWRAGRTFEPAGDAGARAAADAGYRRWRAAVDRSKGWADG